MLLIPPIEPSQSKFWPRSHCSCVARSARVGLNQGLTLKNGGFVRRKHDKHGMLPTKNMLNMEITERTKRKIYSFNQEKVYLNQENYRVLINEMVDAYIFAVTTLWISLDKLCISSCFLSA